MKNSMIRNIFYRSPASYVLPAMSAQHSLEQFPHILSKGGINLWPKYPVDEGEGGAA